VAVPGIQSGLTPTSARSSQTQPYSCTGAVDPGRSDLETCLLRPTRPGPPSDSRCISGLTLATSVAGQSWRLCARSLLPCNHLTAFTTSVMLSAPSSWSGTVTLAIFRRTYSVSCACPRSYVPKLGSCVVSRRRAVFGVHRARGGVRVASRYRASEGADKGQVMERRSQTLASARTDVVCARQAVREASAGQTAARKYHVGDGAQKDQRMQAFGAPALRPLTAGRQREYLGAVSRAPSCRSNSTTCNTPLRPFPDGIHSGALLPRTGRHLHASMQQDKQTSCRLVVLSQQPETQELHPSVAAPHTLSGNTHKRDVRGGVHA